MKWSETQKQRPHELLWMLWFDEKVYLMYIFALCMNKELLDNCAWATLKNVVMNIDFNFLRQTKKLLYMAHFLFVEWREPKYLTVGNRFGHANQFWHTAAKLNKQNENLKNTTYNVDNILHKRVCCGKNEN